MLTKIGEVEATALDLTTLEIRFAGLEGLRDREDIVVTPVSITGDPGARITISTQSDGTAGEFRVNDQIDFSQQDPAVAILADGRFVVAWATEGSVVADEWDVRLKFYGSEGVALTDEIAVNSQ